MRLIDATLAYRAALGAAAYLAPRTTGRALGIDPDANPASPYLARVFGARDVALGVGGLALPPEQRTVYLRLLAGIDAADLVSALLGGRAGHLRPASAAMLAAAAVLALGPELRELRA
jgi:hypothetical protein